MQVVPFFAFFFLWHFTLADCRRLFFFPAILSSLSQPTVFCSSTNTCGLARFTDWCFPLCGTRCVLFGQTISGCCWWTCSTADDGDRVTPTGRTVSAGGWQTPSTADDGGRVTPTGRTVSAATGGHARAQRQTNGCMPLMCLPPHTYRSMHYTRTHARTHTHTHTFNGPFSRLPGWAGTRKVKPNWIALEQETVSGSGISWAICKSAPRCRQITMPAPHHSVFYTQDALPASQPTVSKHWRHKQTVYITVHTIGHDFNVALECHSLIIKNTRQHKHSIKTLVSIGIMP